MENDVANIKELISEDKIESAFKKIEATELYHDLKWAKNAIIEIRSRYKFCTNAISLNHLTSEESSVEMSKIRSGLLFIIDEMVNSTKGKTINVNPMTPSDFSNTWERYMDSNSIDELSKLKSSLIGSSLEMKDKENFYFLINNTLEYIQGEQNFEKNETKYLKNLVLIRSSRFVLLISSSVLIGLIFGALTGAVFFGFLLVYFLVIDGE